MVKTRSADTKTSTSSAPRGKEAQAVQARKLVAIQAVIAAATLAGLWWTFNTQVVPRVGLNKIHVHSIADRLAFTLRHQLPGVLALLISLLHVSLTRFFTLAINPLSNNEHLVEVANRILVNSVEQYILSLVNQLILATHVPEVHLKVIPLISITFLLGRLFFLAGYLRSPAYRAFGFLLTLAPTLAVFGYNVYFTYALGYTHHLGGGVSGT